MAELPTKPGFGAPEVRSALDDTLAAEPSLDPPDSASAVKPLLPAERYRLGAELGRGGMGRVVEAFDLQLGRTVALKEVLPRGEPGIARRFAREVQLTARLEHPSIVPLYDAGVTADGRPFYVMRRVSGRPLDQLMAGAAGLGERLTLLPAVLSAIDAIAHAHRRGVIHRDLKPSNILVGELGETVVIDWGLAKVIGEDDDRPGAAPIASDSLRTQIGSVFGTPGFMAPEQARGEELDPRGDVYALGATLYQLLAGAPPHSGTSATEVIARTGSKAVTPVDVVAPSAPAELVAIVGKALAFDPAGRYPDAGALGEDVRRFLSGQLVAAHRYTPRQRLARFARRHRAPLGVAALAAVTVAVLAWFAVHRIVEERDAANLARIAAADGQRAAEQARDDARRRADQLVVMHARGLLDANPTHALAVLKQLPAGSDRLGDARAVAQAAVMRGAAWAFPSTRAPTTIAELSADARFLLQVSLDGMVQVWDLDRRRLVVARGHERGVRALWAGTWLLVMPPRAAPELFDPFTGAVRPVAVEPVRFAAATAAGDRVALLDGHGAVRVLDVATGGARPLWPGHADELQIASDGSWIAVSDPQRVVVLDPDGRELTGHPGPATWLIRSRFGQLGVLTADKIALCTLSPQPVWTELDLQPYLPQRAIGIAFRGRELDAYISSGKVLAWNGKRPWERLALPGISGWMVEAGPDLLVVSSNDGLLRMFGDAITGELHLPTPLRDPRIAARPGASRVVAVAPGMVVGFELADSLPAIAPGSSDAPVTFVDDDTLLIWRQWDPAWQWYDVRTAAVAPLSYHAHGIPLIADVDPDDGRVLMLDHAQDNSLALLRKNSSEVKRLAHGPIVSARLMPHDVVLMATQTRLLVIAGDQPPREIAKLDGVVSGAVRLAATGFAALSDKGELVRGDLATGALARTRVTPGTSWSLVGDHAGRVVIAIDDRLMLWDPTGNGGAAAGAVEIARLHQNIAGIEPYDRGALLELADHSLVQSSLVPGTPVTPLLPASSRSPYIRRDGKLIIGESVNNRLAVVETATGARWELPSYVTAQNLQAISPGARRFAQSGPQHVALWTLPLAPIDLPHWLDERTNAVTDGNDVLTWSSQPARP